MWVRERACVCVCHCRILQLAVGARNHSALFCRYLSFLPCCCVPVSHPKLLRLWQPRITAVAVLQGLRFVTAMNCASVCACGHLMWLCHPERNEGQLQFRSTLPLNFNSIRADSSGTTSSSSGTTPVNLGTLTYIGTPVFPPFNLRHPRDFKSNTSRRGTLYVCQ